MSETGAREHPRAAGDHDPPLVPRARARRSSGAAITSDGTAYVTTSYTEDGRRHHLAAALVDRTTSTTSPARSPRRAAQYPQGECVYVDLYAAPRPARSSPPAAGARSSARTSRRSSQRVVLDVPAPTRGVSAADAITLRRGIDGGWVLDRDLQFVHPEMAERLNLWRMSEFALERIASPADVYLFRGVGRSNPKDERLFALAEVRELTIVRDENGRVVSLPELEHMLAEALGVAAPLPGPPLAARAPAVEPRAAEPVADDRPRARRRRAR